MIEWTDDGIILSYRRHGETSAIITVLAAKEGRYAGLVAGGQSTKQQAILQPAQRVQAQWRARLAEQLGHFRVDAAGGAGAARWLQDRQALAVINSACAIADRVLPERAPMPEIFAGLEALLAVPVAAWLPPAYVQWELGVLATLGYGLDLARCAVTQQEHDLAYVSPRTGRAVSAAAAGPWRDRLLPLPRFLQQQRLSVRDDAESFTKDCAPQEIHQGLCLTGHFLTRHVLRHTARAGQQASWHDMLPLARQRLLEHFPLSWNKCQESSR
jgi:DNA repair protein RecO (recombination protein O)